MKGRVGDRAHALRLIAEDASEEFADMVLDVWLSDKSPTVQHAAFYAIRRLGDALRSSVQARITRACEALGAAIEKFLATLRTGRASRNDETKAHLTAVQEAIRQLERLWVAALLSGSDTPDMAAELLYAYRS